MRCEKFRCTRNLLPIDPANGGIYAKASLYGEVNCFLGSADSGVELI